MDHFGEFVSALAVKIAPRLFGQTIEILAIVILVRTLVGILVRKWTTSGNSLDCKCALAVKIGHRLFGQKIEILAIVILVRRLESNLVMLMNFLDRKSALGVKKGFIFFGQKIEILDIVILVRTLESNLVRKWTTSGNYNHVKVGTNCTYYTV